MSEDAAVAVEETAVVETHEPVSLDALFSVETPKTEAAPKQEVSATDETSPEGEPKAEGKAETEKVEEPIPSLDKPVLSEKEQYEQRLKETRDWTTRVNAENAQLKRDLAAQQQALAMINKKLDGNWTEEDEREMQQPQISPEQAIAHGHVEGKIAASRTAAYEIFGKDNMLSLVTMKVKDTAGVGQQSLIFDVCEYLLDRKSVV